MIHSYADEKYASLNIASAMNKKQCGLRDKYIVFVKGKDDTEIPLNMAKLEYNHETMKFVIN